MARMTCRCGETLSTTACPNDVELMVYTDEEWDRILDVDSIETWKIPLPEREVWRCPWCKRIYVFTDGSNTPSMVYALETK
jgi:hypothetical protein